MTYALSVLVPSRNEYYHEIDLLSHTVSNVLANSSERTEVVVVLDGYDNGWPLQPLQSHPRLTVIQHNKSIGQRAAINEAARVSKAKYIMKLDAHTAVGKDFDSILIADMQPRWTVCPSQYNLHAYDWKCKKCGWRFYNGPKPERCAECKSKYFKQVVVWHPCDGTGKERGVSKGGWKNSLNNFWRFDSNFVFQYWGMLGHRPESQGDIADTMSLLGACWMLERERYWELGGSDEQFGSWGQQGTEIACKTWLSGGELKVNKKTWFAHFFRVGGLGFPYSGGGHKERAMARCRELCLTNSWPKQARPLSWLIEKFKPIPDFHTVENSPVLAQINEAGEKFMNQQRTTKPLSSSKPRKLILYYTCGTHDPVLELAARNNLLRCRNGHELGCISRERTDFGDWNIVVDLPRSGATMHEQILAGLERSQADYVFLCESDVLYHESHFQFTPPDDKKFYYNVNVWRVMYGTGHAVRTADCKQVSGICASRKLLLETYRKRVEIIRKEGSFPVKRMAYEPGTRGRFDGEAAETWESPFPNIDITDHGHTLTKPKKSVDDFRNKRYAAGWQETDDEIHGWGKLSGRIGEFLSELANG
jgi:predicted Zn-ribbon and HTH transcriptional regulator